jgi:hypothetical protein
MPISIGLTPCENHRHACLVLWLHPSVEPFRHSTSFAAFLSPLIALSK